MIGEWWRCGACGGAGTTTEKRWQQAEVTFAHEPDCPHAPPVPEPATVESGDDAETAPEAESPEPDVPDGDIIEWIGGPR